MPPTGSMGLHSPVPPHRLILAFQLSRDGVPYFACTPKTRAVFEDRYRHHEYLWVDGIRGISRAYSTDTFWKKFVERAASNEQSWYRVQQAIMTYQCVMEVESKPGVGWVYVPPTSPCRKGSRPNNSPGDSGSWGIYKNPTEKPGALRDSIFPAQASSNKKAIECGSEELRTPLVHTKGRGAEAEKSTISSASPTKRKLSRTNQSSSRAKSRFSAAK